MYSQNDKGLGGDFAYLRTRRIAEADILYDLDPASIWTLLQLRQGRDLTSFNADAPVQIAPPMADDEEPSTLVYLRVVTDAAVRALALITGAIIAFTPTPGLLRDKIGNPGIAIEGLPDRLLMEFRHNVVGL